MKILLRPWRRSSNWHCSKLTNLKRLREYCHSNKRLFQISNLLTRQQVKAPDTIGRAKISIMTKHAYLPTTIISDKGTAFTSEVIKEVTEALGINLKQATTKHRSNNWYAWKNSRLAEENAENRDWWETMHVAQICTQAVLNHNTSYHSSIGCEPSRVFHGRIPYNVIGLEAGIRPRRANDPDTNVAQDVIDQRKIIHEDVRRNTMHAYFRYKAYYDKKANASVLKEKGICIYSTAESQPSRKQNSIHRIPMGGSLWPYVIERVATQ